MNAIKIMNEEHQYILRMLKVVRKECLNILQGQDVNYEDFYLIIEFIKEYADEHHHKKEEDILFNKMVDNLGDVAEKLVKNGMLVEHDFGRLYVRNLCEALENYKNGDEEAKLDIIANAISYTHLLERHIDKEDRVIYKFAERELKADVQKNIDEECMAFEKKNTIIKEQSIIILERLENKFKN